MVGGGEGSFIGPIHYRAAMLDGYYELVCGAFSSNYEKSLQSADFYHVEKSRIYRSWEDLFRKEADLPDAERMEAVIIATPNHLHFPQSMMALDKGFHVICDKPATISLAQALELEKKVQETGLVYAITHTYTGYPMVKEAAEIVESGRLGNIRRVLVEYPQGWLSSSLESTGNKQAVWRTDPEMSGPAGCLGDIGTHAANLAEYVTGLKINELCADLTSFVPGRKLDDDMVVLCKMNGGAKGLFFASQVLTGEENELKIRVYGEKGGIEWCHSQPDSLLLKMDNQPAAILKAGVNYDYLSEKTRWNCRTPGGHPEGYIEAFANIYKNAAYHILSLKDGRFKMPDFIEYPTIEDGVSGMKFIEKVLESAAAGNKWIAY
ncbi:MAG: gfo/Idh/MocA family oxidoreductase [Bacteroidetes bacterium]|nr:MAG: gfo/Idh/MocA family oxidoreductase [Bacteroidota bacterium]